ncbi:MAG TPA: HAMP domain-containing sensor histidine kinase [Luteibaculaceae bacterium]|nr:HAMP domain-containing sensor histidine kinase [Luteibaculaceae bacterium]
MRKIRSVWFRLIASGQSTAQSSVERKNVRLSNVISLFIFVVAGIHGIIFYAVATPSAALLMIPAAGGILLTVWLNKKLYTRVARVWLIVWCNVCVIVFCMGFGNESKVYYALFAFSLLPWMLFEWSKRWIALVCSLVTVANFYGIQEANLVSLWGIDKSSQEMVAFLINNVIFMLLGGFLYSFLIQNFKNENRIRRSVKRLQKAESRLVALSAEQQRTIELLKTQGDRLINFAKILSHNVRSHTANLKGLLVLYGDESPQGRRDIVEMAEKSVDALEVTIRDINTVMQFHLDGNGKGQSIQIKSFLLNWIERQNADRLRIAVNFQIDDQVFIFGQAQYMEWILDSLRDNALQFAKDQHRANIFMRVRRIDDRLEIWFKDRGMGVDLDDRPQRIFDLYSTYHEGISNRGFGLYRTKNLLEAMSATISVYSKPNRGVLFVMVFPLQWSSRPTSNTAD